MSDPNEIDPPEIVAAVGRAGPIGECPSIAILSDHASGRLDRRDERWLSLHLHTCSACRMTVESISKAEIAFETETAIPEDPVEGQNSWKIIRNVLREIERAHRSSAEKGGTIMDHLRSALGKGFEAVRRLLPGDITDELSYSYGGEPMASVAAMVAAPTSPREQEQMIYDFHLAEFSIVCGDYKAAVALYSPYGEWGRYGINFSVDVEDLISALRLRMKNVLDEESLLRILERVVASNRCVPEAALFASYCAERRGQRDVAVDEMSRAVEWARKNRLDPRIIELYEARYRSLQENEGAGI